MVDDGSMRAGRRPGPACDGRGGRLAAWRGTRRHDRTFLALNLAHFFDHYAILIFPTAVLALQQEWPGGYASLLELGSWTFILFALMTLPAGWLGDRWSQAWMMRTFWLGTGAALILTGIAADRIWLAFGLGLTGLFAAIYHPVATAMVYATADRPSSPRPSPIRAGPKAHGRDAAMSVTASADTGEGDAGAGPGVEGRSGRALSINGVFGNLGVAAAALGTAAIAQTLGWRWAFILPGAIMLALGLVLPHGEAGAPAARAGLSRQGAASAISGGACGSLA